MKNAKHIKSLNILEINNVDLAGRRFNGYDLQKFINENTIHSAKQIVVNKMSNDKNVIDFFDNEGIKIENKLLKYEHEILSVHSQLSLTSNILLNEKEYINADLVHYHLIHNTKIPLFSLIELCGSKPSILSIHDPWIFTGRCVHPDNCIKWTNGCNDCKTLDTLFPFTQDNCNSLWKLKEKIYKELDIDIIVSTPYMYNMLKKSPITKHFENVHIIPFGIDLNKFCSDNILREETRNKFNIPKDDVVLFFRAQKEFKGTQYIVEALKMLKSNKNITLISCSEKGLLEELTEKYNIIELGYVEDDEIVSVYNACDIFLMPSKGESFGMMAIEAMACSKPVIVFDNTALPFVTFAPDCGVLVKDKSSYELSQAIKLLVENEDERNRRGVLGRKLAEEHYDINVYNKKMLEIYEKANERQINKKQKHNKKNRVDYSSPQVQVLLHKLKVISINIFGQELPNLSFFKKTNSNYYPKDYKIDYSDSQIQSIINKFNYDLYNSIIEKKASKENLNPLKYLIMLKNDRKKIKEVAKNSLKNYPIILKSLKTIYNLLKNIKHRTLKYKISIIENENKYLYEQIKYFENEQITFYDTIDSLSEKNDQLSNEIKNISDNNNSLSEQRTQLLNKVSDLEKNENKLLKSINSFNKLFADDKKNILYYHGGSGNHGCEALVRTLVDINNFKKDETCLYSYVSDDDYKFKINEIIKFISSSKLDTAEMNNDYYSSNSIALSIGGDNYCGYDYGTKKLEKYNRKFNDLGVKTALIGCSIEPDILAHSEVLDDLNCFSLITARETITYDALMKEGINRNTHLIPDSAFTLPTAKIDLPEGFTQGNTIGLNVSDLVQSYDGTNNITYDNYKNLIEYIIENTDYQIALIPHVIQQHNNDYITLSNLFNEYKHTNRVLLINDCICNELKGYISKCKIFVCSRTHASIAAYSTCVPTLVLGYSVKSRGIAKDIFGTEQNYVIPVQSLIETNDLTKGFIWIENNYDKIKQHLEKVMPDYIKRCYDLKPLIDKLKMQEKSIKSLAMSKECTGCSACFSICPQKCITMEFDKEGFLNPITDFTKCVKCDLCKDVCPANKQYKSTENVICYAAKNKDILVRLSSSSGGIFRILGEKTINEKGTVFGAAFDCENTVCHMEIDNINDLKKLQGSKYVQSDLKDTYKIVRQRLFADKKVLFSGTPCQIQGLKSFLNKDYKNLISVDFICHGVPSSKIFKKYCQELEKEYNSKIKEIDFRNKDNGWRNYNIKIIFDNGNIIVENFAQNKYMNNFLQNLSLRNCCYDCKANNFRSGSDITLGDYWGIENIHPEFDDDIGISLVIIKNQKAKELFALIKDKFEFVQTDVAKIIPYNQCISKSVDINAERESFFMKY